MSVVVRLDRWSALLVLAVATLLLNVLPAARPAAPPLVEPRLLADSIAPAGVDWPPSTGLLVAEVVTRGSAASDQYAEIYNASTAPLDLAGLELTYVTASGATVTRKQSWSELELGPGQHLLIANAAGAYAAGADGLFSGGFSTTGGTLVLRFIGGQVIDSLSWGTASTSSADQRSRRTTTDMPISPAGRRRAPAGQARPVWQPTLGAHFVPGGCRLGAGLSGAGGGWVRMLLPQ